MLGSEPFISPSITPPETRLIKKPRATGIVYDLRFASVRATGFINIMIKSKAIEDAIINLPM
ncbi:hypothetical protein GCM10022258_36450 [Aquimarina gracilis]